MSIYGKRFTFIRNSNGTVTVRNYVSMRELTFPNMGYALLAAQAAKGRDVSYVTA